MRVMYQGWKAKRRQRKKVKTHDTGLWVERSGGGGNESQAGGGEWVEVGVRVAPPSPGGGAEAEEDGGMRDRPLNTLHHPSTCSTSTPVAHHF